MTLRASLFLAIFAALFGFIGLNWTEFSTPSTLSFGFAVVQIPIGFVMLGALVAVVALMSAYVVYLQASWALQQRRIFNELESQRKIADQAEESRITDLLARMNNRFDSLTESIAVSFVTVEKKVSDTADATQRANSEATLSLSAHLGEVEDKLDKVIASR